mmetsp:Transcript_95009/g.245449  ORF Transcript_95009/g.245449 Transcript_95009/m.245449 type:complete len:353 (-) Transcript_95009:259-1317(-)
MAACLPMDSLRGAESVGSISVGHTIGAGQFGQVKLGKTSCGRDVAVKSIDKAAADLAAIQQEVGTHILLRHPNVVRLYEVVDSPSAVFMVLEYADSGDLFDHIVSAVGGRLQEAHCRALFCQIMTGVEHCHSCMVTHRDLKPENILLQKAKDGSGIPTIKIADFGLSTMIPGPGEPLLTQSCGSPNYAPPEMFHRTREYRGPEVDVWSSGVVLYTTLTGMLPFDAPTTQELAKIIQKGSFRLPCHLSQEAKHLISRMLVVDLSQRISVADIKRQVWFSPPSAAPAPQSGKKAFSAASTQALGRRGRLMTSRPTAWTTRCVPSGVGLRQNASANDILEKVVQAATHMAKLAVA